MMHEQLVQGRCLTPTRIRLTLILITKGAITLLGDLLSWLHATICANGILLVERLTQAINQVLARIGHFRLAAW